MNETVKAALGQIERNGDHVFCNGDGETYHDVRTSFETALRKSGIEDFRWHDLRHCFASNLVMAGVDINTVRELMRHKTLAMTLRYAHLAPHYKTKAINILDEVMSLNPPQSEKVSNVVSLTH
jgi:site-specific recombinase XerD